MAQLPLCLIKLISTIAYVGNKEGKMEAECIICRLDSVNNDIKKFNTIKFALKMTTFFILDINLNIIIQAHKFV